MYIIRGSVTTLYTESSPVAVIIELFKPTNTQFSQPKYPTSRHTSDYILRKQIKNDITQASFLHSRIDPVLHRVLFSLMPEGENDFHPSFFATAVP